MNRLSKDDLSQMSQDYFQSLDKEKLVEVAGNLHAFAVEQLERLEFQRLSSCSKNCKPPRSSISMKLLGTCWGNSVGYGWQLLVLSLAQALEHPQLKALAQEILRDWDAVVAFFYHPQLPPTNNEAEYVPFF